jgi:hypothetical protein
MASKIHPTCWVFWGTLSAAFHLGTCRTPWSAPKAATWNGLERPLNFSFYHRLCSCTVFLIFLFLVFFPLLSRSNARGMTEVHDKNLRGTAGWQARIDWAAPPKDLSTITSLLCHVVLSESNPANVFVCNSPNSNCARLCNLSIPSTLW